MDTKKLCVIGDPIAHSLSPLIHGTMLRTLSLPFVYGKEKVSAGETAAFLARAKREGYGGFNATMPHKTDLVPLMDTLSEEARLCCAVNAVAIRGGKAYGYNTDGAGFLRSIAEDGITVAGKTVTLLGAGGAARAIVMALATSGCKRIYVCNRTLEKAQVLAKEFPDLIFAYDFSADTLALCATACDLLVNCTPMGMGGVRSTFADFSFLNNLHRGTPVCDIIYNPPVTDLMCAAQELGYPTINGLGMLIHQAVIALSLMTDTEIDPAYVVPKVRSALRQNGIG